MTGSCKGPILALSAYNSKTTSSMTPIFYYRIVISIIRCNFLQSLKIYPGRTGNGFFGRNRTRAKFMRGERSHHCAIPALQILNFLLKRNLNCFLNQTHIPYLKHDIPHSICMGRNPPRNSIRSLSTCVFETRTATGREHFAC